MAASFSSTPIHHHHHPKQLSSPLTTRHKSITISNSSSSLNIPSTHITNATQDRWNMFQNAAAKILDTAENALLSRERHKPFSKTTDPRVQLQGNFAPVPEHPVTRNLPVTGQIPDCIRGTYVRNGANPLFDPVAGHHLFDGDGMVHAVTFQNNSVSYACRFTETERFVQEKALGRPIFPKAIGELHGHFGIARLVLFYSRGLFGLLDHSRGAGVANAGLVFFNGRLLAMSEDDLPYHLKITDRGDLETVGRYDFSGQLKTTMIAHPKVDPVSGELFALSYDVIKKPYLRYFRVCPNSGEKSPDVVISLPEPTMIHDFAITENFVVIPDQNVVFRLPEMIRGGSPVVYNDKKTSRFGILDKKAENDEEIRWIDVPDCFCFHIWNAWEEAETEEVVVIGSCMTPADSIFNECDQKLKSVLSEIRLNTSSGKSCRREIISESVNLEAGMVNKKMLGRKSQFVYLAIAEPWPKVSGFAKVNILTGEMKKHIYGEGKYGGEPMFVSCHGVKEDDGYILAFVHNEKTGKSEIQIVNAVTMAVEATVDLPSRVPYGFHATFITENDLSVQALF